MSVKTSGSTAQPEGNVRNRRDGKREAVIGALWMIDNHTSTVFRCRCVDVSTHGMRLRVPMGYGVREGQSYELTSHLPGQSSPPGLGLMVSRRAQVVRTRVVPDEDEYDIEVGVKLSKSRTARVNNGDALTALA